MGENNIIGNFCGTRSQKKRRSRRRGDAKNAIIMNTILIILRDKIYHILPHCRLDKRKKSEERGIKTILWRIINFPYGENQFHSSLFLRGYKKFHLLLIYSHCAMTFFVFEENSLECAIKED